MHKDAFNSLSLDEKVEDLRKIHSGQNKSNIENLSRYKGFTQAKIELFISSLKLKLPLLFDTYH